jgi:hypothetical protein
MTAAAWYQPGITGPARARPAHPECGAACRAAEFPSLPSRNRKHRDDCVSSAPAGA